MEQQKMLLNARTLFSHDTTTTRLKSEVFSLKRLKSLNYDFGSPSLRNRVKCGVWVEEVGGGWDSIPQP